MITGITFNHDSSCIAVTSDTETIHFFPVPEQFKWENNLIQSTMDESVKQEEVSESTPEDLTEMVPIPTMYNGEKSASKFRSPGSKEKLAFVTNDGYVLCVRYDGTLEAGKFVEGEITQDEIEPQPTFSWAPE